MNLTEMRDHNAKPHDDREIITTAPRNPVFSTIGIVTFAIFLLWLAVTFGGAK